MGVQDKYDALVAKWGREIANEIMLKHARRAPAEGKGNATPGRKRSPVLPGSFENGKRR